MTKIYKESKIPSLIRSISRIVQQTPRASFDFIWTNLTREYPELTDKSVCPNCAAKMEIKEYTADILDALLLLKMAEAVREGVRKGKPFTEANLVYTPELNTTLAIKCRTTMCDYLNFVKQPEGKENTGFWLITNWGWAALRGDPVKKSAYVWRGKVVERSEDTIVLSEMFKMHADKVAAAIAKRKLVRNDYRAQVSSYDANEWAEVVEFAKGRLL